MEPRSQWLTAAPLIANCAVLLAGAQISVFQQDRLPAAHQAEPGQLASPAGAWLHGAANHVWLDGESAGALGGQADTEQGVDPNRQVPVHAAPPPGLQSPEENPAWLTNSSVTSRASSVPPLRQIPPPPANPEPLK